MADYNPYTVGSYQQMAATMAQSGGGRNMSGLGARPSNQTDKPTGTVDFTTIDPTTGKQTDVATIDYGDDGGDSPTVIYAAAADAATQAGSIFTPQGPMANAINLYSMPNMAEQASDFVYRADRDDAITSAISDVQAEEQTQINAAISSVNSAITMGKTDAEIAKAFFNDMGGFGSDKPDETGNFGVQGTTLKDVTDTQQGLMSNPQPLYDFAEEMRSPSIATTELPSMSADEQLPIDYNEADYSALGEAIRKAAEDGTLSSKLTNLQFVRSDGDRNDPSFWDNLLFGGETETPEPAVDPETGQAIKSADDIANERMDEMASQGLMSRRMDGKDGDMSIPTQYGTAVFEMSTDLKEVEGTEPHIGEDWENVTLALGIVPTSGLKMDGKTVPSDRAARGKWLKSNGYVSSNGKPTDKFKSATIDTSGAVKDGVKRSDYGSDTAWSAAVINNFKEGAQEKVAGFDNLGVSEQKAVIDIAWNMGVGGLDYSGNQSLIRELSKAPEERSIPTMLEAGKHVTEGGKVLRGLARRKALAVNSLISDPNQKIEFIRQTSRGNKTYHTYVNAQGQAVKTLTLGKKHSGSPDGLISVETGEEVTDTQRETSPRPMLRPTE